MTHLADRGRLPRPIRAGGRLAAAVVLWLALASIAQAQVLRWDMPNEYPETSIHGEGDQFFARDLAGRSAGRIAI